MSLLTDKDARSALAAQYRDALLGDVIPFWLRHGIDREQGGYLTALDRDGTVVDTDKSIWFQGRGAWTFATLCNLVEKRAEWLEAARTGIDFLRRHGGEAGGKLWFTVTREGKPLRRRRYAYSEAFAAIALAAWAKAAGEDGAAEEADLHFSSYIRQSLVPGTAPAKVETATRPMRGIGVHMIGLGVAQEIRATLGERLVEGRTCSEWVDWNLHEMERWFIKPELKVVLETVGPRGEVLDHADGRTLNPGHAIEAAWFILREARFRGEGRLRDLGVSILDWMWERGWDTEHGGLFYFRDLKELPVQEYWHDMKFWWPHCEAIIATQMAHLMAGEERHARWHQMAHDWSFKHFADPEHGEWFGYLHRDGRLSNTLKGSLWKGPFHLPRMLLVCWKLLDDGGVARWV
ncbi:MAG: AGE family epimerase/isomerase [Gemmataceae bacterium]|nr:AGE family epimerase/isomerase [Gemmataceae bacterium]